MIHKIPRLYVACDQCGETFETHAESEQIAAETATRKGWLCKTILAPNGINYRVDLCPKCRNK